MQPHRRCTRIVLFVERLPLWKRCDCVHREGVKGLCFRRSSGLENSLLGACASGEIWHEKKQSDT